MRGLKLLIIILCFTVVGLLTLGPFSLPVPKRADREGFSAERAAMDIRVISMEPHSIEHPEARERVRDYIAERISSMGLVPEYFPYDSISDRFGRTINIANLYAKIEPVEKEAESYLLFVAHFDSRFAQYVRGDKVYSFGAADDGYGVAVILEALSNLLGSRHKWVQGVKVLFTDSEESNLEGIKNAIEHDSHIFEDVALVINIEARGVKGPAILFETSPGNEKILELYKSANFPYTYSLTSAIYNVLPNYTDYTCLKERIPGMNFSVIDNLNYYHTNLDNYENISLRSLQHYGEQIVPIAEAYLSNRAYSSVDAFRSEHDVSFFTIPHIGLIIMTKRVVALCIYISFALLCLSFLLLTWQKQVLLKGVLKATVINLILLVLYSGLGVGIAYLLSIVTEQEFNVLNLTYIKGEYMLIVGFLFLILLSYTAIYRKCSKKKKVYYALDFIFAGSFMTHVLSIASFHILAESSLFFVPAIVSSVVIFLSIFRFGRYVGFIGSIIAVAYLLPLFYCLVVALTSGSLFIFALLFTVYISTQVPIVSGPNGDNK